MSEGWRLEVKKTSGHVYFEGRDVFVISSFKALLKGEDGDTLCIDGEKWEYLGSSAEDHVKMPEGSNASCMRDVYGYGSFRLHREVVFSREDMSRFYTRLIFENAGTTPVSLLRLVPFYVRGEENLKIGSGGYKDWSIFRHGRHKNDLPSVCIAGEFNDAYRDCFSGLSESGRSIVAEDGTLPLEMISDQLTVIRGDRGKGPGTMLLGFVSGKDQLVNCIIRMDDSRKKLVELEANCLLDGIMVDPGEKIAGEWLKVDACEDPFKSVEEYVKDKIFIAESLWPDPKAVAITEDGQDSSTCKADEDRLERVTRRPSVYCTWYYYGPTVSQEDVEENLEAIRNRNVICDVFLIDDGWEKMAGEWEPNEKFPKGMKHVADSIREKGMIPGIWTCPFIVDPECDILRLYPEWILRDKDGKPERFYMNGINFYVLDTTNPEVLKWIEDLYRKLVYEWGFTYHKLDFIRAVALNPDVAYYDKKATRAQAYRMGFEAVRRGAGEQAYICVCGGLYDATLGIADGQRTGSDVRSTWPKPEAGEEISAPKTVKQNILRYWMNDLWDNDPDALMVRRNDTPFRNLDLSLGLLNDNQAKTLALNQYWGGGQVCFTEPMKEIDDDRLGLLRHIIPSAGNAAVPRDMFEGKRLPSIMDTAVVPNAAGMLPWHTVSVVNWREQEQQMDFILDEYYLGSFAREHKEYVVSEFYTGRIWERVTYGTKISLGSVKPHSAVHLRVAPENSSTPVLVYTNGHFSMGATEISTWDYHDGRLRVGINWKWQYPLELKIKFSGTLRLAEVLGENPGINAYTRRGITTVVIPSCFVGVIELLNE